MQYICCNFETMLEQQLLNDLDAHVLQRLTAFCRKRQLDRVPKTIRSKAKLAQLAADNAEWIKDVQSDVPRATGGYRRFIKTHGAHVAALSPKLSPTVYSTSLARPDSYLSSSPNADFSLSPPASARLRERPPLPAANVASPATSPLFTAHAADDSIPFDMDDLSISEPAVPLSEMPTLSLGKKSWQRPLVPSTQPQSFRAIMEQSTGSSPQRAQSGHPAAQGKSPAIAADAHVPMPTKSSQRERKRLQSNNVDSPEAITEALTVPSGPAWRSVSASSPWKAPSVARNEMSLQAIQAAEETFSRQPQASSSLSTPVRPALTGINASSARRPSGSGKLPDPTPAARSDAASAIGAQVITPTRIQATRSSSGSAGRGTHSWANYSSTVSLAPVAPPSAASAGQAFSTIQDAQSTEREALKSRREPRSLAEIQEEEASERREAEFLTWFEEESKRTRTELGIESKPQHQPHRPPKAGGKPKKHANGQSQRERGRGQAPHSDAGPSHTSGGAIGRGKPAALNPDAPVFTIPGS